MEKKTMLIINPEAGKGQYRNEISDILEVLCKGGYVVTVYMTERAGHATELARTHAERYDVVACCGGDGTFSETIAGLMDLPRRPVVGYIPMGTTNDVASTLRLPRSAEQAAQIILDGTPIPFDVGRVQDKYFTYIAAFGAFTEVSYQTPRENKQTLGHLAYLLEGVGQLNKITPHNLVCEFDGDGRIEGEFIFGSVTNTTSIAGMVKLKPDLVELGDGEFEVLLVKNPRNIMDLNHIVMEIFTQKYDPDYVKIFRAKKVRFLFDEEVAWTRDGEAGGLHREVSLQIVHPGVDVLVPGEKE